ncbi:MAG: hypothetical protein HOB98_08745 [Gammaproteobacteria bacterium]|jgi:hypothetical protein|nr:hypothetical protein [Gammaproteobacteria bacterium]MBT3869752.1 hypothetical protein [Gammaproteobacteria bacterium]MBT4378090.1 hypothetical protein [Gammaproteobacteria bacterium]MBT4616520.1 hypothetical protein [Gammaproteobacteria bacterium]MBT5198518.1 hypothetical protein [Gammaproteobacteria bacterium]
MREIYLNPYEEMFEFPDNPQWFENHLLLIATDEAVFPNVMGWELYVSNSLRSDMSRLEAVIKKDTAYIAPVFDPGYHFDETHMTTNTLAAVDELSPALNQQCEPG